MQKIMMCPPLPWGGEVAAAAVACGPTVKGLRIQNRIQSRIQTRIQTRIQSSIQSRIQSQSQARIDAPNGVGVGGWAYRCGPIGQSHNQRRIQSRIRTRSQTWQIL